MQLLEDWKTASEFCHSYNKRASKLSGVNLYPVDIFTHHNFFAKKFSTD